MTLRSQLQDALDEVTPPAPTLEGKVTAFVLAHEQRGRRVGRGHAPGAWTRRFRGTLTMVAAILVVALIGGLILAGRAWRDMNAPPQTVNASELKSLESRPLLFPPVSASAQCPKTPLTLNALGLVLGDGPVYMVDHSAAETSGWGTWLGARYSYQTTHPGLVLIRARDLQRNQSVAFVQFWLGPSGATAVGPVLGTDHIGNRIVQLRPEAVMHDADHTPPMNKKGELPPIEVTYGLPKGSSGCIGFQFDGPNFTENFTLDVSSYLG